jgi:hypothetical protein
VVLFSSAAGVTAYNGSTGARLWSAHGAVPEGIDHSPRRIYLTEGSNLVGVDPRTGKVKATASGSAVNGAAGVYVVRNGAALGLDQGASGGAWGYALAVQRVTRDAPGLPWPHYFVDLSGVGGSADQAGNLVVIAVCRQLAPRLPPQPSTSAPSSGPPSSGPPSSGPPSSGLPSSGLPSSGLPSSGTATSPASSSPPNTSTPPASTTATPNPDASPSATAGTREPAQGCMRPELVALNL